MCGYSNSSKGKKYGKLKIDGFPSEAAIDGIGDGHEKEKIQTPLPALPSSTPTPMTFGEWLENLGNDHPKYPGITTLNPEIPLTFDPLSTPDGTIEPEWSFEASVSPDSTPSLDVEEEETPEVDDFESTEWVEVALDPVHDGGSPYYAVVPLTTNGKKSDDSAEEHGFEYGPYDPEKKRNQRLGGIRDIVLFADGRRVVSLNDMKTVNISTFADVTVEAVPGGDWVDFVMFELNGKKFVDYDAPFYLFGDGPKGAHYWRNPFINCPFSLVVMAGGDRDKVTVTFTR